MSVALSATAAVALDWLLGEPVRCHPLVGFGRLADGIERRLNRGADRPTRPQDSARRCVPIGRAHCLPTCSTEFCALRVRGLLAVAGLLAPAVAVAALLCALPSIGALFDVAALYFALGHRSLHDHARPVAAALRGGDEAAARRRVSRMVSRDSAALDISAAATESVLENGNDGVFGALFWFVVAGGAGAVLYRLANTLDAMWGYRNTRYRHFGWAAARLDDVLNYLPARLTALTYALLGHTRRALACWHAQAPAWDSPNAGPVMAAGAGALGIALGGPARYEGEWHDRPPLGWGEAPQREDIERALGLVRRGVVLWLAALFAVELIRG